MGIGFGRIGDVIALKTRKLITVSMSFGNSDWPSIEEETTIMLELIEKRVWSTSLQLRIAGDDSTS